VKTEKNTQKAELKSKPTVNCNNCSYVYVHIIVNDCSTQHRTLLAIFPLIFHCSCVVYWRGGDIAE